MVPPLAVFLYRYIFIVINLLEDSFATIFCLGQSFDTRIKITMRRSSDRNQPEGGLTERANKTKARNPKHCAARNQGKPVGAIPTKVSVMDRAILTAGLAKKVEEVNQYPAVTVSATVIATECCAYRRLKVMALKRITTEAASLKRRPTPVRSFEDTCNSERSNNK
jgi:hypothetical protein